MKKPKPKPTKKHNISPTANDLDEDELEYEIIKYAITFLANALKGEEWEYEIVKYATTFLLSNITPDIVEDMSDHVGTNDLDYIKVELRNIIFFTS